MVNNKIGSLKVKKEHLQTDVYNEIPEVSELGQEIVKHIVTVKETTYLDTKSYHLKKLQNLEDKTAKKKKFDCSDIDLSGLQQKKWVINLFKYKLNQPQTNVLAKGLNYTISPPDICAEEFVLATELACKNLSQVDGIQLRAKVASILKSSKPPKQNGTEEEDRPLKICKRPMISSFYQWTEVNLPLFLTKLNTKIRLTTCWLTRKHMKNYPTI